MYASMHVCMSTYVCLSHELPSACSCGSGVRQNDATIGAHVVHGAPKRNGSTIQPELCVRNLGYHALDLAHSGAPKVFHGLVEALQLIQPNQSSRHPCLYPAHKIVVKPTRRLR